MREMRNISAQVVSLPLVFCEVWLSLLLLGFYTGMAAGFLCVLEDRVSTPAHDHTVHQVDCAAPTSAQRKPLCLITASPHLILSNWKR